MSDDVAVIIPVRDGGDEIAACVRAVLTQIPSPTEVVVVDNGSRDDTAARAAAAGARVINESRPGSYAARNAGIAATTAPILAFTDADCVPDPEWLARLIAPFSDPDVVGTGGAIVPFEVRTAAQRWAEARRLLVQEAHYEHPFHPMFATANAAYRRSGLEQVGGFYDRLLSGGDADLSWRIQLVTGGRLQYVPAARVKHHLRARVRDLVRQQQRYARGHAILDARWRADPRYQAAMPRRSDRLRVVWLAPLRVPYRLVRRTDAALPLVDAAVRAAQELARWQARHEAAATEPLTIEPAGDTHR